jgi:ClpP class serine protease
MTIDWLSVLFILLLLPFAWQWLRDVAAHVQLLGLIRGLERSRGSKVVVLIHKEQKSRLFGMTRPAMIDLGSADRLLDELRKAPVDKPVDVILHTPGGIVIAAEQIAQALAARCGRVTAFVPLHALSGGTLVAIAADEIAMDKNAVLGRIDPQLLYFPAQSIKKVVDAKGEEKASEPAIILGDMARKALVQVQDFARHVLAQKGYSKTTAEHITEELISDKLLHDAPVFLAEASGWGLHVTPKVPEAVYQIVKRSAGA